MKEHNRQRLKCTPWHTDGKTVPLKSRPGWYQALFGMVYWNGFYFSWAFKVGGATAVEEVVAREFVTWRGVVR